MRSCVIVTRPQAQAAVWVQALRAMGLDVQALPLIEIAPAPDAAAVRRAWVQLPDLDFVMFVSANAVEQFFALRPSGAAWPATLGAGSTGQGTTAALLESGVPLEAIAQPPPGEPSESEALWGQVAHRDWSGRRVMVVRGEDGRNWLAQQFQQAGAQVAFLAAYRRSLPQLSVAQAALLVEAVQAPQRHVWLFSSSESVGHLLQLAPGVAWSRSRAVATHPRIAQAARQAGFAQVIESAPRVEAIHASCTHLEFAAP